MKRDEAEAMIRDGYASALQDESYMTSERSRFAVEAMTELPLDDYSEMLDIVLRLQEASARVSESARAATGWRHR